VTLWHEACSYARRGRRRTIRCEEPVEVRRRSCEPVAVRELVSPRRRYFVEGPIDAAYVLLEERRAELSLTLARV